MSIEVDWQVVAEDVPPDQPQRPSAPGPRRRLSPKWWIGLAIVLVTAVAVAAIYMYSVYRQQTARVEHDLRPVARLEAQAIAADDLASFLALQDPDDAGWRAVQKERFGRLERVGLPEFGWEATGVEPQLGPVTLEPGGARLDVTYQFSVTQPMPDGPTSITLRVPQFYRQTPSGWVRASPSAEYWGGWQTRSGKYFAMMYTRRDADVLDGLLPRMDNLLARMCTWLHCPSQPIDVYFENSSDSLANLNDFSFGFDSGGFLLKLPSPQLYGMPADAPSRDELYRAIGTRVMQALIYEASGWHLNMNYSSSRSIVRWGLAQAGLAAPLARPELTRALALRGSLQPLSAIPLRSRADEPLLPLAFTFIDQTYGAGSVMRLVPAMGTSQTLGEAISATLRTDPMSLEANWQKYLDQLTGASQADAPPTGELWLSCSSDNMKTSAIWRVGTDGFGLTQMAPPTDSGAWLFGWSRDGQRLASLQSNGVSVINAEGQLIGTFRMGWPGWLPDSRLWIMDTFSDTPGASHLLNLDTGEDDQITGTWPVWSPDGTRVAYFVPASSDSTVWVADADGGNARAIGPGYMPAWSPDSKRVAFLSGLYTDTTGPMGQVSGASQIQMADVASASVTTFMSRSDVLRSTNQGDTQLMMEDLGWSPDGSRIVVDMRPRNANADVNSLLVVFDANTGAVRARWRGPAASMFPIGWLSQRAWSSDGRYLALAAPAEVSAQGASGLVGDLNLLDTDTGEAITVPGVGLWDWSPAEGQRQWLAAPQGDNGVLLLTPDLTFIRRIANLPNCYSAAWRPAAR